MADATSQVLLLLLELSGPLPEDDNPGPGVSRFLLYSLLCPPLTPAIVTSTLWRLEQQGLALCIDAEGQQEFWRSL